MRDFFDWISNFFQVVIWDNLKALAQWFIEKFLTLMGDAVIWLLTQIESAVAAINGGVTVFQSFGSLFGGLSQEVLAYLTLLNVQGAILILFAAWAVRLTIVLIRMAVPFI